MGRGDVYGDGEVCVCVCACGGRGGRRREVYVGHSPTKTIVCYGMGVCVCLRVGWVCGGVEGGEKEGGGGEVYLGLSPPPPPTHFTPLFTPTPLLIPIQGILILHQHR